MATPGLAVTLVEVNVYEEVPGCSVPRLLSRSGLDSSAAEDATANVTGATELPEKVTGVPTPTNALFAGLSDASSTAMFVWTAPKQIVPGGVGTYPRAGRANPTTTQISMPSATSQPTLDRLNLTQAILLEALNIRCTAPLIMCSESMRLGRPLGDSSLSAPSVNKTPERVHNENQKADENKGGNAISVSS
jgi:hypothetical protein